MSPRCRPPLEGTYFSAKYQRITARRGPMRALVAVEHAMVIAAWHMLTNGEFYRERGTDYYTHATRQSQSPSRQPTRSSRLHRHPETTGRYRIRHPARQRHNWRLHSANHQPGVTSIFVSVHTAGADFDERFAEIVW